MAIGKNIKGITIEIDGNVTPLQKALSSVNGSLRQTQSALRDIDKLLKLNPGNVTLLKQKQTELKNAIEQTESRLKTEKEALRQLAAGDQTDEVREQMARLERQIIEDENSLKSLKSQMTEFGSVAKQVVKAAADRVKELGTSLQEAGANISSAGRSMTTKVTTPIVGGLGAAVKVTADFDKSMSSVYALSGATGEEMDALRETAREMGRETLFSASEAADAMKYMGLAGWDTNQIIAGTPAILDLATAAGEDLASVSDIVTDGLTAFGLAAEDSAHFSDVLAVAMSSSNTSVEQLGEAFKYVGPVAGAMGYSIEDVSLALGTMANSGIKGSQAGTTLRNIMQRMAKPTEEVQRAMDALGISLADDEGNMKSLDQILAELRQGMEGVQVPSKEFQKTLEGLDKQLEDGAISEEEYNEQLNALIDENMGAEQAEKAKAAAMLGGARAMSGILAITNATAEDYNDLASAINNADGAASDMAAVMKDNVAGDLTILKDQVADVAIQFGDIMVPGIRDTLIPILQKVTDFIGGLTDEQKEMAVKIALVVAAVGPLLLILGGLISTIGTIVSGIGTLMSVFSLFLSPVGLVIAAIAAVIAIGVLLYKNWDTIKEKLKAFKDFMLSVWNNIKRSIANIVSNIVSAVTSYFNTLRTNVTNIINGIKSTAMAIFYAISSTIASIVSGIASTIANVFNGIKTTITNIFNTIKSTIATIVSTIASTIANVFNGIRNTVSNIVSGIKNSIVGTFNGLVGTIANIFNNAKNAIVNPIETARSLVSGIVDRIKNLFNWNVSLPHIKMPHFAVSPPGWKVGDLLKGTIPRLSIDWYKTGGIFTSPSVIGVGEAGAEAVIPLDRLWSMLDTIARNQTRDRQTTQPQIVLNGRELTRGLKSLGVVFNA